MNTPPTSLPITSLYVWRRIQHAWGWCMGMTQRGSVFKSRDITLPPKVSTVKAMVFPAVMYGCENWTTKKADRWRTDTFKWWCWRRLLRVPWTARRSNQSILKEINPEYSLEGLILELKLQYFGHRIWRANSLEKTLMLRKNEGKRRRGWPRMRWLDGMTDWLSGHEFEETRRDSEGQGSLASCSPWGCKEWDMT